MIHQLDFFKKMKDYRFLLSFMTIFFAYGSVHAQSVSGIIYDGELDDVVIGATVLVKNTENGTITDIDGKYTLNVSSLNDTLLVSFIGYETQIVPLNGRAIVDVTLNVETNQLDEIMVVGYGRQKRNHRSYCKG